MNGVESENGHKDSGRETSGQEKRIGKEGRELFDKSVLVTLTAPLIELRLSPKDIDGRRIP